MILHCNTLKHPLDHAGTQQRDRMPAALADGFLSADDRSMERLIAFAGGLAAHVRFFDATNKEAGDWQAFWQSDPTALLAIIAATDLDSARTGYRSAELEYYRRKKREDEGATAPGEPGSSDVVNQLVTNTDYGVYGLALLLLQICRLVPATHPLKKEIAGLLAGLKGPLKQLIQWHKAIDPQAIKSYAGFIGGDACALPWGLPNNAAFECIDYLLPYEYVTGIWRVFLKFYQVLMIILQKARKAFQSSLRTRKDHQPHIGLYITFLYLFRYLQDDLNGLIDKHLLFYYHDVLRLARKAITPDKAYLYFDIAANLTRYRLADGTEFKAGADSAGRPISYALMDELVISSAKLVEKQNLYLEEKTGGDGTKKVNAIFLPVADKRDGLTEEWPAGTKAWQALSGLQVFNRQYYKYRQLFKLVARERAQQNDKGLAIPSVLRKEMDKYETFLGKLKAFSGFSISSTELWLDKGFLRAASITFNFEEDAGPPPANLLALFDVDIITEKGLVTLNSYPVEIHPDAADVHNFMPEDANQLVALVGGPGDRAFKVSTATPDPSFRSYNRVAHVAGSQQYLILLGPQFPAVLPVDDNTPPFVRFRSKDNFDPGLPNLDSVQLATLSIGPLVPATGSDFPLTLQRIQDGVVQSDTQLVINGDPGDRVNIFIRMPELFFKWPATLIANAGGIADKITGKKVSFWYGGVAVQTAEDGKLTLANTQEKPGLLTAPVQIDTLSPMQVNGWAELDFAVGPTPAGGLPVTPFVLGAGDLTFEYTTMPVSIPAGGQRLPQFHYISHFTSLGDWIAGGDDEVGIQASPSIGLPQLQSVLSAKLFKNKAQAVVAAGGLGDPAGLAGGPALGPGGVPVKPADGAAAAPADDTSGDRNYGNLFLGFDGLQPNQTLSLLFEMATGTGNPDHYAPTITWSYLKDDDWIVFPPQYILTDTTNGLGETGIIRFQIPGDIDNGNTWIKGKDGRTDLYWLRATAEEIPDDSILIDALPLLVDIFVNAGEVIFGNDQNMEEHLEAGLPAGTITAMKFRDVNVKTITQPLASFDGRDSETDDTPGYVRRVHERLRHKDRAVTLWDYERLLLQTFPSCYVTKCLTHSFGLYTARPGYVTMAVIPDPGKMTDTRRYYPAFDAGDLATMKEYLLERTSFFVGNYGGPDFCCCEDGCQCEPGDRLTIINARFEPIRLKVCVRFAAGKDPLFYSKQLNEDIKSFLSPWSGGDKPLTFGTRITLTSILQFLEGLNYVDVILGLKVRHFATRQISEEYEDIADWASPEEIVPYTAASVLTTYLDRLNEDNPNVIDHVICVATGSDHCHCGGCKEDEAPASGPDPHQQDIEGYRHLLMDMWAQRTDTTDVIRLFTAQVKPQVQTLTIDKIKFANKIGQLKVSVTFADGKISLFFVNNPHLG